MTPIDLARAGSDTHVHVGFFGVPGGVEVATLGAAWQSSAAYGPSRHADAWGELVGLGLPADTLALVGFAFDPSGGTGPA